MRLPNRRRAASRPAAAFDSRDPRRWVALAVLVVAGAMNLIDTTVVTVALPVIGRDLRASGAMLEWLVAGYGLALALGLIIGGRLGDVFGRRRIFMTGLVGFTAASTVCGLAPNPEILIGTRLVQGAFAALMVPQVVAIIAASFPAADRTRAFGIFGAVSGIATIIGPILSGLLLGAHLLGWRPIFLVNVPVGLALIPAADALVPESRSADPPRLDLAGVGLLTIALVLLLLPLVQGPPLGWPIWSLAALAASIPALALFAIHQRGRDRRAASPLVPPSMFRQRTFAVGILATAAIFSVPPALLFVVTMTLQSLGSSPLRAGLAFVPLSLASGLAAIASGALAPRLGRRLLAGGAFVVALGVAGLLFADEIGRGALTTWALLPGMLVTGFGMGVVAPVLIGVVLSGVDPRDAGSASGVRSTASQLGGALGVALIGMIYYGAAPATHGDGAVGGLAYGLAFLLAVAILTAGAMLLLPKAAIDQHMSSGSERPGVPSEGEVVA